MPQLFVFSSHEQEVLKVSFWDQSVSSIDLHHRHQQFALNEKYFIIEVNRFVVNH